MPAVITGAVGIAGFGTGLELSSANILGSAAGQIGQSSIGQANNNVYANAASGNLIVQATDQILIGIGLNDVVARTYNSQGTLANDHGMPWSNGADWSDSFSRFVTAVTGTVNTSGSTVQHIAADGSVITYNYQTTGPYTGEYVANEGGGAWDTLSYSPTPNTWTWTDGATQATDTYGVSNVSGSWRLTGSTDHTGANTLSYYYNTSNLLTSIASSDGDQYTLSYNSSGKLTEIQTTLSGGSAQADVFYGYDSTNTYLTGVTENLSPSTSVNYTVQSGDTLASIAAAKLGSSSLWYVIADDNGLSQTSSYPPTTGTVLVLPTNATYTTTYAYNGSNQLSSVSQSDGSSETFTYGGTGGSSTQVTSLTQSLASGATTPTNLVYGSGSTTATDGNGDISTFGYPTTGSLAGELTLLDTAAVQTSHFTYDSMGDLLTETQPNGNVYTYTYNAYTGTLASSVDSLGDTTTYTYDNRDQVLTKTQYLTPASGSAAASGAQTTSYIYSTDGKEDLLYTVSPAGEVTQYLYNGAAGEVTSTIQYANGITSMPLAGTVSAVAAEGTTGTVINLGLLGGAATSISIVTNGSHGTATVTGTTVTYTPTSGIYTGPDSFTYTASNAVGTSATGTVNITVAAPAPIANASSASVIYDSSSDPIALSLSGGAPTSLTITSAATDGVATVSGTTISYTPTSGYSGQDSFQYLATNSAGNSAVVTVAITVGPQIAIAGASSETVAYDVVNAPIALNLSGGAATSLTISTAATHGTATVSGTTINYTPTSGYSGLDSFQYTATNAAGISSAGLVSILVNPPPPIANSTTATVLENSTNNTITLGLSGGLATAATVTTGPSHGTISVSGTTILYTPTSGYSGVDSFQYDVSNTNGTVISSVATVTLAVNSAASQTVFLTYGSGDWVVPTNWNPNADTISVIGAGGGGASSASPSTYASGGGGGGYSTVSNVSLTAGSDVYYSVGAGGAGGSLGGLGSAGGDTWFGSTTESSSDVAAKGGSGGTHSASAGGGASASGIGTTRYSGGSSGAVTDGNSGGAGAAGPNGAGAASGAAPSGSSLAGTGGGGADGGSASAALTGSTPTAGGNNSVGTDGGAASGGYGSDGGAGTAAASVGGAGGGGGGEQTEIVDGKPVYRAASGGAGANGEEWTSAYGAGGGGGAGAQGTVSSASGGIGGAGGLYGGGGGGGGYGDGYGSTGGTGGGGLIVITYTPDVPVAATEAKTAYQNTALTFDPRTADTDPYSSPLSVTAVTAGAHGLVSFTGTSLTYTALAGYTGSDSFTYTIGNGLGSSSTGTINVTVAGVAPTASSGATIPISANSNGNAITPNLTGGPPTSFSITTAATHGTASVSGTTLIYTPTPGYTGTDSFQYTAYNATGSSAATTVNLQVNADAPQANASSVTVATGSSANPVPLNRWLGTATSLSITATAAHGTATVSGTNITYTPNAGYTGADSFQYTATNGAGVSSPATVSIDVTPLSNTNAVFNLASFTNTTEYTSPTNINWTTWIQNNLYASATVRTDTAYDSRGNVSSVTNYSTIAGSGSGNTTGDTVTDYSYNSAGLLLSQQTVGFNTSQTNTYDGLNRLTGSTDANGDTTTYVYQNTSYGLTTIATNQANGTSVTSNYNLAGELVSTSEVAATTATVQTNSSGNGITLYLPSGTPASLSIISPAGHGTASVSGTTLTYTPNASYSGSDSFQYLATYSNGTSAVATVNITVNSSTATTTAPSFAGAVTTNSYNSLGQLKQTTDPDGNNTYYLYDRAGRKIDQVNATGDVTGYSYNANNQILETEQYATPLTSTQLTDLQTAAYATPVSLATVLPWASGADQTSYAMYDDAGRQIETIDALGNATTFQYNGESELVSSTRHANPIGYANPEFVTASYSMQDLGITSGNWTVEETGDFLGDGKSDILIENTSGVMEVGELGPAGTEVYTTIGTLATGWTFVGAGDYLGDGKTDFLLKNASNVVETGEVVSGTASYTTLTTLSSGWSIVASGDFVGDGKSDFLIESTSGAIDTEEYLNGSEVSTAIGSLGSQWRFVGAGNFLGDGKSEFLIADTSGNVDVGEDIGGTATLTNITTGLASGWNFVAVGDFLGNGKTDYLIENSSGVVYLAEVMTGTSVVGSVYTQILTLGTTIVGGADLNGDGKADIVTEQSSDIAIWKSAPPAVSTGADEVLNYSYDNDGRLAQTSIGLSGSTLTATTLYDSFGNVVATVDPDGYITRNVYDSDNRLIYTVNGDGDVTQTTYDADSHIVAVQSYANPIAPTTFASLPLAVSAATIAGDVTASANDHITRNVYDADGRLIYAIDAAGDVTQNFYDSLGDLVATDTYATPLTSTQLSATALAAVTMATATPAANASAVSGDITTSAYDTITRFAYNGAGQAIFAIDADGDVVQTTYDADGNVLATYAYATPLTSGQLSALAPASMASTAQAALYATIAGDVTTSTSDRLTRSVYNSDDQLAFTIDADGDVTSYSYDDFGHVVQTHRFAALGTTITGNPTYATMQTWATANAGSSDQITRSVYDADGRLVYVIDALGDVTQNTYDPFGNVVAVKTFATPLTSTQLSGLSTVTTPLTISGDLSTSAFDETTRYVYNAAQQLIYTIDALGDVTQDTYDNDGNLLTTRAYATPLSSSTLSSLPLEASLPAIAADLSLSASDQVTSYTYDAVGRVLTKTDAAGATTTSQYDAFGNVVVLTDPNGNAGYFYYDSVNRQTLAVDADGFATSTSYTANSQIASVTRSALPVTGPYSAGTLPTINTSSTDEITRTVYDAAGRVLYTIDADGNVTQNYYDAFGDVASTRLFATAFTTAGAQTPATMQTWVSANSLSSDDRTWSTYDADGRLTFKIDSVGDVTGYSYDAFGNQSQQHQYVTPLTSTQLSTLAALTVPETTATIAGYVGSGSTNDSTTTYTYDLLNRQTQQSATVYLNGSSNGTATVTTTYDAFGNVIKTVDADGNQTFFYYDVLNRKVDEVSPVGTLSSWTYNAFNDAVAARVYGDLITLPSTPGGAPPSALHANNYRETDSTYDSDNRLIATSLTGELYGTPGILVGASPGGSFSDTTQMSISGGSQTYDKDGNVTSKTDGDGNVTYFYYDADGRKTAEVDPGNYLTVYTLDTEGNTRTEQQYATPVTVSGGLTLSTPLATILYDAINTVAYGSNGNVISLGTPGGTVASASVTTAATHGTATVSGTSFTYTPGSGYEGADSFGFTLTYSNGSIYAGTAFVSGAAGNLINLSIANGPARSVSITTAATHGTASVVSGTTNVVYTPNATYSGSDSFGYKVTYASGATYTSAASIAVNAPSTAATPNIVAYNSTGNVINLDLQDSPVSSVSITVNGTHGTATVSGTTVTYNPATSYSGGDSFQYLVTYANGSSNAGTVAVTVDPTTTASTTNNVAENSSSNVITLNADPPSGSTVSSISVTSAPSHGTTSVSVSGTSVSYTPTTGYTGVDSFEYQVKFSNGSVYAGMTAITVNPPWIASASSTNTVWKGSTNNVVNPSLTGSPVSSISITTAPTHGTVTVSGSTVTYSPTGTYTGTDSFNYTVTYSDGTPNYSGAISLSVVAPVTTAPTNAAPDRVTTFTYNQDGERLTETRDDLVASALGSTGALTTTTTNATVSYTYNGLGEVTSQTEATGDYTDYSYDSAGRQTKVVTTPYTDYALATVQPETLYAYNGLSNLTSTTVEDANGAETTQEPTSDTYGAGGRLATSTDAMGNVTTYNYDDNGNVTSQIYNRLTSTSSVEEVVSNYYDAMGRVYETATSDWNGSAWVSNVNTNTTVEIYDTTYDAYGEVVAKGINGSSPETYGYDLAGHLTSSTANGGVMSMFVNDQNGNAILEMDSIGAVLAGSTVAQNLYSYVNSSGDALTMVTSLDAPIQTVTTTINVYDGRNEKTEVLQPQRQLTSTTSTTLADTKVYDAFGDVTAETDPAGAVTLYSYNVLGDVTQQQSLGYLVGGNYQEVEATATNGNVGPTIPTLTYDYDLSGRLVGSQDANGYLTTRKLLAGTGYAGANPTVLEVYYPDHSTTQVAADVFGNERVYVDQLENLEERTYNALNQLTSDTVEASSDTTYTTISGDTLGSIATAKLGSSALWYLIAYANGLNGVDSQTTSLTTSTVLNIPAAPPTTTYTVATGNTLGSIAAALLGSSSLWTVIADENDLNATSGVGSSYAPTVGTVLNVTANPLYTSVLGDTLGSVAAAKLGNANLWYLIADANGMGGVGSVITYSAASTLTTGTVLVIPSTSTLTTSYTYDQLGQQLERWNSVSGAGIVQKTDYDSQGRVDKTIDYDGNTTTYSYAYSGSLATTGMGTYGGWAETINNPAGLSETLDKDFFGRNVGGDDFNNSSDSYAYTYDLGGRLTLQTSTFYNSQIDSGGEYSVFTYFNTGKMATDTDASEAWVPAKYVQSTQYGYDAEGNETVEDYAEYNDPFYATYGLAGATSSSSQGNATSTYDALNRMTSYTNSGFASASNAVAISYQYDAANNIRNMVSTYENLVTSTAGTAQDYWYLYDSMNRFITTQGSLINGAITLGSLGIGDQITYDAAGNRLSDTTVLPEVYTSGSIHIAYDDTHVESYTYTPGGYLTDVSIKDDTFNGTSIVTGTPLLSSINLRDAMGRIVTTQDYLSSGTLSYYQTSTYDNDSEVTTQNTSQLSTNGTKITASSTVYNYNAQSSGTYSVQGVTLNNYDGAYQGGGVVESYQFYDPGISTSTGVSTAYTNWMAGSYNSSDYMSQTLNSYIWFNSAELSYISFQPQIHVASYSTSTFTFNANGFVKTITKANTNNEVDSYINNAAGEELGETVASTQSTNPVQYYYYMNGIELGSDGTNGPSTTDYAQAIVQQEATPPTGTFTDSSGAAQEAAAFGNAYTPISPESQAATNSTYTVHDGDTLQSIAQTYWGDSSLWYLIADANGLDGTAALAPGTTLEIPAKVTNLHNSSATFAVYNPTAQLGNVQPGQPKPPHQSSSGCGGIGAILVAIVAVAVAFIAGPEIIAAVGSSIGAPLAVETATFASALGVPGAAALEATADALTLTADVVGGAIAGAVGDALGQGLAIAVGAQSRFNWAEVGLSALSAGVTAGLSGSLSAVDGYVGGPGSFGAGVLNGAVGSAVSQGIEVATGLQHSFSWTNVAVAGIEGGVGNEVGGLLGGPAGAQGQFANSSLGAVDAVLTGTARLLAGAASESVLSGRDFGQSLQDQLPSAIGQTVGNLIASSQIQPTMPAAEDPKMQALNGEIALTGAYINQAFAPGAFSPSPSEFAAYWQQYTDANNWIAGDPYASASNGTLVQNGTDPIGDLLDQLDSAPADSPTYFEQIRAAETGDAVPIVGNTNLLNGNLQKVGLISDSNEVADSIDTAWDAIKATYSLAFGGGDFHLLFSPNGVLDMGSSWQVPYFVGKTQVGQINVSPTSWSITNNNFDVVHADNSPIGFGNYTDTKYNAFSTYFNQSEAGTGAADLSSILVGTVTLGFGFVVKPVVTFLDGGPYEPTAEAIAYQMRMLQMLTNWQPHPYYTTPSDNPNTGGTAPQPLLKYNIK